jgi:ribosomal RNA-processing protein 9
MGAAEALDDEDESGSEDEDDEMYDRIGSRLAKERLLSKGKFFRNIAERFEQNEIGEGNIRYLSGHQVGYKSKISEYIVMSVTKLLPLLQQSVTCVAITQDNRTAYSGSKDNAVIAWDVETGSKQIIHPFWQRIPENRSVQSQDGEVLAVAVSSDGRYVVSGGRDNEIKVFDARNKHALIQSMKGHRDAVTGLCFRKDTYTLYSSSLDRCVKHWEVADLAYMETMFGHQVHSLHYWFDCYCNNPLFAVPSGQSVFS